MRKLIYTVFILFALSTLALAEDTTVEHHRIYRQNLDGTTTVWDLYGNLDLPSGIKFKTDKGEKIFIFGTITVISTIELVSTKPKEESKK